MIIEFNKNLNIGEKITLRSGKRGIIIYNKCTFPYRILTELEDEELVFNKETEILQEFSEESVLGIEIEPALEKYFREGDILNYYDSYNNLTYIIEYKSVNKLYIKADRYIYYKEEDDEPYKYIDCTTKDHQSSYVARIDSYIYCGCEDSIRFANEEEIKLLKWVKGLYENNSTR